MSWYDAQNFLTGALNRYADQVRNHGSATRIDLNSILTPEQMAEIQRMEMQGDTVLQHADANHDGVIDVDDLPLIMARLNGVSLDEMPPVIQELMRAVDLNGDGRLDEHDVEPIIHQMQLSEVGSAILDEIRQPDGSYEPTQVIQDFTALMQLGDSIYVDDRGFLDLSQTPPEVRQALIENLDHDGDGNLTPADVAGFLATLTVAAPPPPHSGQPHPVPGGLPGGQPFINPAQLPPPGGDADGGGGWIWVVLIFLIMGGLGFGGYHWWKKRSKQQSGPRRMVDVPGPGSLPSNYCPPLAGGAPLQVGSDISVAPGTHNVDALNRARAANHGAMPSDVV